MKPDEIISLESPAFKVLIEKLIAYVRHVHDLQDNDWISTEQAMNLLQISSPTTLSKLRNEGQIKYSQPMHKLILYSRTSILAYLDKHAKNTF
jgi:hypothetical protein